MSSTFIVAEIFKCKKNTFFKWYASLAVGIGLFSGLSASYTIQTFAGTGTAGYNSDVIAATSARLNGPRGSCIDSSGNLYFADTSNNRIRKVTASTGIISTVAGTGTAGYSGDGAPATSANLSGPFWVCLDNLGNLYVSDTGNNRIRKFTEGGTISTVAGTGTSGYSGDGAPATSARINTPYSICTDSSGNLYFVDISNNRIRKVTASTGIISTVAGTGTAGFSGDGGLATSAQIRAWAVCLDSFGNIYISDTNNNRIRRVTLDGIISTIAGTGTSGYSGDGGAATAATFQQPFGIYVDNLSNIYIAGYNNNAIRKFTVGGNISTIAGTGTAGFSGDGGLATAAKLNVPRAICMDSSGNFYVSDTNNNRIRKLLPPSITLEVDGADSATVSADLAATTVHKTGTGASVLSGNNSGVSILALKAGLVQVAATNNIGRSVTFAGGNMDITSGTVAVPTAAVNAAATITTNASAFVIFD